MLKGIFNKLLNKDKKSNFFSPSYEKYLMKLYGKCNDLKKDISLLIISDTHGTLDEDSFKEYIKNNKYDICIMLGDHFNRDIDIIVRNVDRNKLYGVMGNHDYDYLDDYEIQNINGKIININGNKILGMEGSFKYKPVEFPSFTQEESIKFFEDKERVDILVSHDKKFDYEKLKDPAHQGLVGITKYIYENKIPIHIHGHIHESYTKLMLNGTKEISVFGYELIKIGGEYNV